MGRAAISGHHTIRVLDLTTPVRRHWPVPRTSVKSSFERVVWRAIFSAIWHLERPASRRLSPALACGAQEPLAVRFASTDPAAAATGRAGL